MAQIDHSAPRWTHRKPINTGVKIRFIIKWKSFWEHFKTKMKKSVS